MELPDDVDSLKQLVRSLQQQLVQIDGTDRFRLVVESAPNGIIVSNREGKIVMTNPKAQELFGYSEKEFVERTIEDLETVLRSDESPVGNERLNDRDGRLVLQRRDAGVVVDLRRLFLGSGSGIDAASAKDRNRRVEIVVGVVARSTPGM